MAEQQPLERIMMLISITQRGSGRELVEFLQQRKIDLHCRCSGSGTAPSEMMDFLGLGSTDKDIVISFATQSAMQLLAKEMSSDLNALGKGKGIMMMFAPEAINQLTAAIIARSTGELAVTEGSDTMKSEYKHSLIFAVVKQGYTEQVMQTARKAGATGGTIIRARLANADNPEQFHGVTLQAEREIVTILAPDTIRDQIMEDVNREFGLRSKAQGIIGALPVEKAFKI